MRFKLPSYTLTVRALTSDEFAAQVDRNRDYFAIDIRAKGERRGITLCVGGPQIMTQGEVWDETTAARSAISFASAPWCADSPAEKEWMESHGENLGNEAFCHRTLGLEMRRGF